MVEKFPNLMESIKSLIQKTQWISSRINKRPQQSILYLNGWKLKDKIFKTARGGKKTYYREKDILRRENDKNDCWYFMCNKYKPQFSEMIIFKMPKEEVRSECQIVYLAKKKIFKNRHFQIYKSLRVFFHQQSCII